MEAMSSWHKFCIMFDDKRVVVIYRKYRFNMLVSAMKWYSEDPNLLPHVLPQDLYLSNGNKINIITIKLLYIFPDYIIFKKKISNIYRNQHDNSRNNSDSKLSSSFFFQS